MLVMLLVCRKPWLDSWSGDLFVNTPSSHMCVCVSLLASPPPEAKVIHAGTDTYSDICSLLLLLQLAEFT